MWQRMLCILFYIFFMIAKSCRSGVCSPDSLMCSLNLHNHNQKFCRTSLMNCSKTRPQDCLVFYFRRNARLPEMKNEVLVVLKLLWVGDYTDIYGSDEQRSERPEHQGEGERGIKRSKIVEELEGELALSSLPKKVWFFYSEKTNSSLVILL